VPFFRSQSFYVKIVTAFIGLLILTVLPILSYSYHRNKTIVLDVADDLMRQISDTVIQRNLNYFMPASTMVETSAKLAGTEALSPANIPQLELYTLGVLKSYPQVTLFYFGDEQGNFIQAGRLPDGTLESQIYDRSVSPPAHTTKRWTDEFKVVRTEKTAELDYDPRARPWFTGAKEAKACCWTDLYLSATEERNVVVTTSYPVIDREGRTLGVWGMDIDLDEISSFLKNLDLMDGSIVFIFNSKNEVVAYPMVSDLVREDTESLRPIRADELGVDTVTTIFREYLQTGKDLFLTKCGGKGYLASFTMFPKDFPALWKVAVIIPEEQLIGKPKQLIKGTLVICSSILLAAILLAFLVARSISGPLKLLADKTKRIKDFQLDDEIEIKSRVKEVQMMSDAISNMKTGLQAFRMYVPAELVRQLIRTGEEARPGGQRGELTVFFSDIADFTSIAEQMPPEHLMLSLSEYFDEVTKILGEHKATVDKYIGDGILAFWGAPIPDEEHAFHACSAALLCQERIGELNRRWEAEGRPPFITRMGISTGQTVVGNVGSSERLNYTVMGDNVNLASRLEGANKTYQTKIMVSAATYEIVSDRFWLRPLDIVAVKGKSESTMIYELAGRKTEDASEPAAVLCREFSRGFEAYMERDWGVACEIFRSLLSRFPSDAPAELLLDRCLRYLEAPPKPEWDGIERRSYK
jgi:adenylate cyclase